MDFNKHQSTKPSTHAPLFEISKDDALLFYNNDPALLMAHNELLSSSKDEPTQIIELTREIMKKYQNEPIFAYHLERIHLDNTDQGIAKQIAQDNYRKFPTYLLTRCRYGLVCLGEKKILEAAAAVNYTFDLHTLYPKRSAFHFIEIVTFYAFAVQYFCALKDFNRATSYIAELVAIDKDLPVISQLSNIILIEALEQNLSEQNIALLFSRGIRKKQDDEFEYEEEKETEESSL